MRTWADNIAYATIAAAVIVIAWILLSLGAGCVSDRGLRDAAVGLGESFGAKIVEWKPIDVGAARAPGEGTPADARAPDALPWDAIGFVGLGALSLWKWFDARKRYGNGEAK